MPKREKKYCYDYPRPALTVDVALFHRTTDDVIEVLLIKRAFEPFKGMWSLPGGFVDQHEPLIKAAARELQEETGVRRVRLEQFGAFGDPGRDPRGHTVSIGFTACLKKYPRVKAADDAEEARWYSVTQLPRLAFDHKKLVRAALCHAFGQGSERAGKSSV
ncbi:MAG TPA: NUDIX hydrolase [Blastocatellia bacterium]|nr:NUDIX hydrolase [Blastocatellia bacterium]